jgi:hypothetical protein
LAIPIAIVDYNLLKPGSGGWISLNFRGYLIGAYAILLLIHFLISSFGVKLFSANSLWMIHGGSFIVSVAILSIGVTLYITTLKKMDRQRYEASQAKRQLLVNVLELNEWSYLPNAETATEILVTVTSRESGRFATRADGKVDGDSIDWFFYSDQVPQRQVAKGEKFIHHIPLKRHHDGVPTMIEITLYLFADSTGSAGANVTKIYTTHLTTEDDGSYFYSHLPEPVSLK